MLDWGPHYFGSKENVGVVVRGDRPDVQLAALQTDTVRALVLTKGIPPIEYVYYEANQRGIPVVVVPDDTAAAAAKLDSLLPLIEFDHEDKLKRVVRVDQDPSRSRRHKGGRQSTRNPLASQGRKRAPQD